MNGRIPELLRHLSDVKLHSGADASLIAKVEADNCIRLPSEHRAVLQASNGIEVYAGYLRLYGMHTTETIDAHVWNELDFWKFAWKDRCSQYWCFGGTAWGDQYAYALDSLRAGEAREVYFLDALSMTPQVVAPSFSEFLERELVRSAKDPYDVMIKRSREKFGPLEVHSHIVYIPSLLLGGVEDINNVHKMDARSAMVCNGDIALQLDAGADGVVKGVQPYEDESHRMRLRIVWT